jgi:ribosomal protein S10
MTERDEADELCSEIAEMARRVGARFVPDPKKIAVFRKRRAANGEQQELP